MKRVALAIACLLCLAPAAEAKSTKRCAVRGADVAASNSKAIAYARDVSYDELTDATEVWGCLRGDRFLDEGAASNPSLLMAQDAGGTVVTWTGAGGTRRKKDLH